MKTFSRRRALIVVLLLVFVLILAVWLRRSREDDGTVARPHPVRVQAVQTRDVPVYLDAVGTVTPSATVTVRAQVQGTLASVAFTEGQPVKQGDVLATIDDRQLRAQLQSAEGTLARDHAQLANARRDLERMRGLVESGSASRQQLDAQDSAVQQAQGAVRADQGAAENLRVQLGHTRITAPVDGIAGLRAVDVGNLVAPSDADGVVTLTSMTPATVKFAVPIGDVAEISQARQAGALRVDALERDEGKLLAQGTLQAIDNRLDDATGTVMLRARFDDAAQALFPNQFVSARVHVRTLEDALVVPLAAIRHGASGAYLFVVEGSTAQLQPVELGPPAGELAVVRADGLKAGMQVAVEGLDALEDGVEVTASSQALTEAR